MGYTLKIGESIVNVDKEYNYVSIDVKLEQHDKAPAFGEPTDHQNQRWPSYSSWGDFCRFTGLYEMFFDKEDGLINQHPGQMPLLPKHKEQIDEVLKKYKEKYPNAVAGYSPKIDFSKNIFEDADWPEENNWLTRLEWLKYWVDWALENCKQPIFKNT